MKDRNQNQKEVSQEYEGTALKIAAVLPDGMLRTGVGRGSILEAAFGGATNGLDCLVRHSPAIGCGARE